MEKKHLSGIGAILLIALGAILISSYCSREWKLNYVEQVHFQDGSLYYVDRGEDDAFRIFRSDADGEWGEMITCARYEKERYRRIRELFFDNQGNVYALLDEINVKTFRRTGCRVFLCDFKGGKLRETGYDFTEITQSSSQTCIQGIRDGLLYYFDLPDVTGGTVRVCTMNEKQEVEQLDQIELEYPTLKSQFFLSDSRILLWTGYDGEVFARKLGEGLYLKIDGITGVRGSFQSLADDGGHMAYVLDHEADCIRRIDLQERKASVAYTAEDIQKQAPGFSFQSLIDPDCTEEGFCGGTEGIRQDGTVSVCSYINGKHQDIETVTLAPGAIFHKMWKVYLGILAAAALVCLYWCVYCRFHIQTILVRIILVFMLGLLLADEILERWIEQTIREQLERNQTMALSVMGAQLQEQIRLLSGGESLNLFGAVQVEGASGSRENAAYTYSIMKADEAGRLRIYASMSEYRNVPVEWCCGEETMKAVYKAFETGKNVNGSGEDGSGRQSSRYVPIVQKDGTVYGVLAVTASGNIQDYQIWYYQQNLKVLSCCLILVITVILVLILLLFLLPLKKLKECAGRLAEGEMGVTVPVRGHDEVADISAAFNKMSLGIAQYVRDIREMSDGYYKFIPARILELLGKESIQQVELGDEITEDMTILSLHTIDYHRLTASAEKVYTEINQILSMLVEPIDSHHGVVEHFEDSGLSAFFTGESREALDAAVEIHRSLDELLPDKGRTIAVSYGFLMLGVIGHEKRMEVAAISAHSVLAKALGIIGSKYGARILITHRVYQQIPDFESQYHARYIGNVCLSAADVLERVYDVYDGDTEEEFYYKELTKPLFEKGVELFVAKKFYEARLIFVEVLKRHRKDRAAKEYLYRCDQYYKLADTEEIDTVIEKF